MFWKFLLAVQVVSGIHNIKTGCKTNADCQGSTDDMERSTPFCGTYHYTIKNQTIDITACMRAEDCNVDRVIKDKTEGEYHEVSYCEKENPDTSGRNLNLLAFIIIVLIFIAVVVFRKYCKKRKTPIPLTKDYQDISRETSDLLMS